MNYYISDLHLFHANCTQFDNRPFVDLDDMHETMRSKWNRKITNDDIVYILGDISCHGNDESLIAYISTLKGRKILIRGNHDDISDYRYLQLFEDSVDDQPHDLVLCHYPVFSWKRMGKGTILLY